MAGVWSDGVELRGYYWSANTGPVDLGIGSRSTFEVRGIDRDGRIYASLLEPSDFRCLEFTVSGGVASHRSIDTADLCLVLAVSDGGTLALRRQVGGEFRIYTWSAAGGFAPVSGLEGWSDFHVAVINDAGHFIARSDDFRDHYFWDGTTLHPLEAPGFRSLRASDLNDRDQVVGMATDESFGAYPFVWDFGPELPLDEAVAVLAADVTAALAAAGLPEGNARSLIAKLDAALAAWSRGDLRAAQAALRAFVAELDAMVRSGRLALEAAAPLTEAARQIGLRMEEE